PTSGPGVKVLGDADTGPHRPIALSVPDARHHLHVLGATGTGKSTLLAHLILQDITARRGVVVIDPKGDLILDLLHRIPAPAAAAPPPPKGPPPLPLPPPLPPPAAGRVVLFAPDAPNLPPPRFNILDGPPDLVADHVVGIFRRIYTNWWGPRTDDVLRAAILTHPTNPTGPAHLGAIPDLLTNPAFRRRTTTPLHHNHADRTLAGFWTWYDTLTEPARAQVTGPVLNKLRAFLLRPFIRDTIATTPTTLNMPKILDGGICL